MQSKHEQQLFTNLICKTALRDPEKNIKYLLCVNLEQLLCLPNDSVQPADRAWNVQVIVVCILSSATRSGYAHVKQILSSGSFSWDMVVVHFFSQQSRRRHWIQSLKLFLKGIDK